MRCKCKISVSVSPEEVTQWSLQLYSSSSFFIITSSHSSVCAHLNRIEGRVHAGLLLAYLQNGRLFSRCTWKSLLKSQLFPGGWWEHIYSLQREKGAEECPHYKRPGHQRGSFFRLLSGSTDFSAKGQLSMIAATGILGPLNTSAAEARQGGRFVCSCCQLVWKTWAAVGVSEWSTHLRELSYRIPKKNLIYKVVSLTSSFHQ